MSNARAPGTEWRQIYRGSRWQPRWELLPLADHSMSWCAPFLPCANVPSPAALQWESRSPSAQNASVPNPRRALYIVDGVAAPLTFVSLSGPAQSKRGSPMSGQVRAMVSIAPTYLRRRVTLNNVSNAYVDRALAESWFFPELHENRNELSD